jgi:hypothetical protein
MTEERISYIARNKEEFEELEHAFGILRENYGMTNSNQGYWRVYKGIMGAVEVTPRDAELEEFSPVHKAKKKLKLRRVTNQFGFMEFDLENILFRVNFKPKEI